MEILKIKNILLKVGKAIGIMTIPLLFTTCGEQTIEVVLKIRVDTFISSDSKANHATLNYLSVDKSAEREDRIIFKLPTKEEDYDEYDEVDKCIEEFGNNPLTLTFAMYCAIYYMPMEILSEVLTSCDSAVLQPENLTSAVLIFNTVDDSAVAQGALSLHLLSRPWFHATNWSYAHPFSSKGAWVTKGGDLDTTISFENSCTNLSSGACAAGEIKFEVTDYFKSLIQDETLLHFGMLIKSTGNQDLANIHSAQTSTALGPRVVATYSGNCNDGKKSLPKTFYLGSQIKRK